MTMVCFGGCANILAIMPTPSYSHQVPFQPIWKELSLRGHQVTTITTDPVKDPSLVNLKEIDLSSAYPIWNKEVALLTKKGTFHLMFNFVNVLKSLGYHIFLHPEVNTLIKNNSATFDVVMSEFLMLSTFAFGERFKCPTIAVTSSQPNSFLNYVVGNPNHVIAFPDLFLPEENMTLGQSIRHFVIYLYMYAWQWYNIIHVEQKIVDDFFGTDYLPLIDILKGISLVLTNSHPVLHKPRPLMPNVIQIGGIVNRIVPERLSQKVVNKLNSSTEGFIYFSLASDVQDLTERARTIIMQTFSELPYMVLCMFDSEDLSYLPKNVVTAGWLPQHIILGHPNVKLFITQGNLQSIDDAINARVPMLIMPFNGDQEYNAKTIASKRLGLMVDPKSLRRTHLKKKIFEVINNPMYKNRMIKFADIVEDQPIASIEKAIWWIEYVIRHKGAKHLKSPILDIPTYRNEGFLKWNKLSEKLPEHEDSKIHKLALGRFFDAFLGKSGIDKELQD
ncbi:hypothetical protein FQA39_LY15973 [Lamprigera yunnana]|nr:hypothetical protein FQA39_LY15973 [Lamprigera yunnana]